MGVFLVLFLLSIMVGELSTSALEVFDVVIGAPRVFWGFPMLWLEVVGVIAGGAWCFLLVFDVMAGSS